MVQYTSTHTRSSLARTVARSHACERADACEQKHPLHALIRYTLMYVMLYVSRTS